MPHGFTFHTASIKKALTALRVNICPHMTFGDPNVLNAFHRDCPQLENHWSLERWVQCASSGPPRLCGVKVNCESCKTWVNLYLSEGVDETTTLWAQVSRRFAKFADTVTDPTWIAYLYMPADFERLQGEWQADGKRAR